jgi:putative toxin-antitoxin system antitoxin component (TIGR02293 family)
MSDLGTNQTGPSNKAWLTEPTDKPQTNKPRSSDKARLSAVARLLALRKPPEDPLETHEMLLRGLSAKALVHLVRNFVVLRWDDAFEKAVGMSQRTYQRHVLKASKPLNPEQTGRTWKLAEVLAKATAVFGSKEEAEQWLETPATGLDQRRPIDLLATPAGVELVEDFLVRLEYGVYV